MRYSILVLCILFFAISCKNQQKNTDAAPTATVKPIGKTAADLGELYKYYHASPANQKQIDENKIIEYAVANKMNPQRSLSGLYYEITQEGTGATMNSRDQIVAHYRGTTLNGVEFDSSYGRGKPISFKIGEMIGGWNEAVTYLKRGSKAKLLVPSHQAYGVRGLGNLIGPYEVLVFDMEILNQ